MLLHYLECRCTFVSSQLSPPPSTSMAPPLLPLFWYS